jgi:molybdopterin converting factor small subunit
MAAIRLPAILAREAGGRAQFETQAPTLRAALLELPVVDLLFDERGELRRLVNVYVDGRDARDELDAPLTEAATIRVVAAVAGGAVPLRPPRLLCSSRWASTTSAAESPSSSARSR